jgi:hypothetical protein
MPRLVGNANPVLRVPTEHEEQREFVWWFRKAFPLVRIFAIPNGGARSKREGGRLKLEGVSPGVPDLFIPEWRLWVEFKKTKGGSVSAEQKDWIAYLEKIGYQTFIARGCVAAKEYALNFKATKEME